MDGATINSGIIGEITVRQLTKITNPTDSATFISSIAVYKCNIQYAHIAWSDNQYS